MIGFFSEWTNQCIIINYLGKRVGNISSLYLQASFKRNKIDCPSCGTKPLVRSSDAILKLRRLASARKARKSQKV